VKFLRPSKTVARAGVLRSEVGIFRFPKLLNGTYREGAAGHEGKPQNLLPRQILHSTRPLFWLLDRTYHIQGSNKERRLGLTSASAACLRDDRQPGKVEHEFRELITQRVMAFALDMKEPTMRRGWRAIRFTSCWSVGVRSTVRNWLRNLLCYALKMLRIARDCCA
jgi:hypothetical protein